MRCDWFLLFRRNWYNKPPNIRMWLDIAMESRDFLKCFFPSVFDYSFKNWAIKQEHDSRKIAHLNSKFSVDHALIMNCRSILNWLYLRFGQVLLIVGTSPCFAIFFRNSLKFGPFIRLKIDKIEGMNWNESKIHKNMYLTIGTIDMFSCKCINHMNTGSIKADIWKEKNQNKESDGWIKT